MIKGLIGKKVGMTHLFGSESRVIPVTVLELEEQCSQEPIDRFVQHCVGYDFNPWVRANG